MGQETVSFTKLMVPTIQVILGNGGSASNAQIESGLIALGLDSGAKHGASGTKSELSYRAAWARTYLKIYGALENPDRGIWRVTPKGQGLTEEKIAEVTRFVQTRDQSDGKNTASSTNRAKDKSQRSASSSKTTSYSRGVSLLDQTRTIIALVENGILTRSAADAAIRRLSEANSSSRNNY